MKKRLIIVLILIVVFVIGSVSWLGRIIEKRMIEYVRAEVIKVSKVLIRDILNDQVLLDSDIEQLFKVVKNDDGTIELIDFDTVKVNMLLGNINQRVFERFLDFEHGRDSLIYSSSIFFSQYSIGSQHGLSLNVPLGIIFSNPIIVSMGPKIPVKLILSGQVESDIVTSIKQYGINNVLLQIEVEIKVREQIVLPFSSEYVDISLKIPLVIELINGKVPENFFNSK